jgi:copper chaperone
MYELLVDKMHCGGCASRVTKVVQAVDSTAVVNVDLRNRKVLVESEVDAGFVIAAITLAGYPVRGIEVRS